MNFLSMEYFAAVADKRSFTRAAESLHITQQTLSAHIAALEQELGCRLLLRRSPLELTYAGEVFLRYALNFQEEYRALKHEFCDITANQRGVLRVGIAYIRGRMIMPGLIPAFQRSYPNIQVELVEGSNEKLLAHLLDGRVDLAVAAFQQPAAEIETREFYREEICMLVPRSFLPMLDGPLPQGRLCARDLRIFRNCPFVMGIPQDIGGQFSRRLMKQAGFYPAVRAQTENIETLLQLCVRGVGIAFTPDVMVDATLSPQEREQIVLLRFQRDFAYPIRFGWRRGSYQWSMIQELIRTALEVFPQGGDLPGEG